MFSAPWGVSRTTGSPSRHQTPRRREHRSVRQHSSPPACCFRLLPPLRARWGLTRTVDFTRGVLCSPQLMIEKEKSVYKEAFAQLRELKAEIEHLQMLLEQSRGKLQKDFEQWLGVMLRQQMSAAPGAASGSPIVGSPAPAKARESAAAAGSPAPVPPPARTGGREAWGAASATSGGTSGGASTLAASPAIDLSKVRSLSLVADLPRGASAVVDFRAHGRSGHALSCKPDGAVCAA